MKVFVILPTYNERENLGALLEGLFRLPIEELQVLVVDDHSPDGTGQFAEAERRRYPNLTVLHRAGKLGLGTAYLEGFRFALAHGADRIIEMDADGSHPIAALLPMLETSQTADLVLGSRYVRGGAITNWNWIRRTVSRCGNWYARFVLGVHIHDLTGGYKCFRRTTLERLGLESVASVGYNFQVELTYKALLNGMTVVEYPITFIERQRGRSKFSVGIILESVLGVWRLRRLAGTSRRWARPT